MPLDMRNEPKASLLDSPSTLRYSGQWAPLSALLALCSEDTSEIIWMVVCDRCTAHALRAHGTGGRARSARRSPYRQWGQLIPLLWHDDFRRRALGWLPGIGDESTPVNTES